MSIGNKYLFLDIDGVLVTSKPLTIKDYHHKYQVPLFDTDCVFALNFIIKKTNPTIVLSSDWKLSYSITQINEIFRDNKVIGGISDFTPNLWGVQFKKLSELEACRGSEILKYVNEHNITKFVAIDDLNLSEILPNNFAYCSNYRKGIADTNVINNILKIIK